MEITLVSIVGWVGNLLLAVCGLPQAIKSYRQGHSEGVSRTFVWTWFLGEICAGIYASFGLEFDRPILFNVMCNVLFIGTIMKFMYYPRRTLR